MARSGGGSVAAHRHWYLEGITSDGSRRAHPVTKLPFRVGREAGNDLAIDARGLSRQHAELRSDGEGGLLVADLGSTNGTFVNRERITAPRALAENDVVHFGNAEYRLGAEVTTILATAPADERTLIVPKGQALSENFVRHERQFEELLQGRGLAAALQPIVRADDGRLFAYELLGRSTHPELPAAPARLFHLAALLDREVELSEAFRRHAVPVIAPRLNGALLFVNAHPKETFSEAFFASLERLRALPGAPQLVVEVHETAVVEVERMRELAARLAGIGMRFAYDDFGAGQARLNELGEVPPHFVKFDMGLLHRLHEADAKKQRVVRELVKLVLDLGSVPLAEGIELEAEAAVCREMGFRLVQGYLTGRPVMVEMPAT